MCDNIRMKRFQIYIDPDILNFILLFRFIAHKASLLHCMLRVFRICTVHLPWRYLCTGQAHQIITVTLLRSTQQTSTPHTALHQHPLW